MRFAFILLSSLLSMNMFEYLFVFLLLQSVLSIDERQTVPSNAHPLFLEIFRLLDQLHFQVHKMQMLISRTDDMIDRIPTNVRPMFSDCVSETYNVTRMQYSINLNEAEVTRIPEIKSQLTQATTIEQQWNAMNKTDRIVADITLNVVKPSLAFLTGILECLKRKSQISFT